MFNSRKWPVTWLKSWAGHSGDVDLHFCDTVNYYHHSTVLVTRLCCLQSAGVLVSLHIKHPNFTRTRGGDIIVPLTGHFTTVFSSTLEKYCKSVMERSNDGLVGKICAYDSLKGWVLFNQSRLQQKRIPCFKSETLNPWWCIIWLRYQDPQPSQRKGLYPSDVNLRVGFSHCLFWAALFRH